MTPADAYAVVLKDLSAGPMAPEGFLISRGHTRDSARAFMRSQPGFLGRALTLAAARDLGGAALSAGLVAMLAREADIPTPPKAIRAVKIEPKTGGFDAAAGGAIKFIPYEAVSLIAASAFDAPAPGPASVEHGLFAGIMRLAGAKVFEPVSDAAPLETFFRADIIAEDGTLRLLLEPEALDFSPLGAARSHSSLANFRALLAALSSRCPGALKNPFLSAFLSSRPLATLKLSSAEACDTDLSRVLLLGSGKN